VVLLLAVLTAAPRSSAAAPLSGTSAKFTVSISGKFTSSGHASNPCWDANENPIVTQQAAATTWTFATTKAGRAEFEYLYPEVGAGTTKLITVAATGARTASESPNCALRYRDDQPIGSSCGTRQARYLMSIYANGKPGAARVGYGINQDLYHLAWPEDPWGRVDRWCPGLATVWSQLTVYSAPPTPISMARIFNKRVRRIVVNGTRTGHAMDPDSSSSWTLDYKITLTRRH
jgi:hypothetical protein